MTRPAVSSRAPASQLPGGPASRREAGLVAALIGGASLCLILITIANPGATRMYASPWSLALTNALLLPALVLLLRAFDARRPLLLPALPWCALAMATALVILGSALASPYRATSLLWSAPLLAALVIFFLTFDWLQGEPARTAERREKMRHLLLLFFAGVAVVSLALWSRIVSRIGLEAAIAGRNSFPLGHANYTAGLGLVMLPTAVAMMRPRRGRMMAAVVAILALILIFTSGSRGGLAGLATMAILAVAFAPFSRCRKVQALGIGGLAVLGFALTQPRTRAMFLPDQSGAIPNLSNVQRSAMLTAGWRMGEDRPVLGWGAGTTPLAFPRYRAGLEGGAEDVLQLHSLPAQIWAEFGGAGIACLLGFIVLVVRAASREPVAAVTLGGYGIFSLTDWQLDIPVFGAVLALSAAQLAGADPASSLRRAHRLLGNFVAACLALFALLARRDPVPELNARALMSARDPAATEKAVALLDRSLALNPDQEIAHFNLGWLLLVSDPPAAEKHFIAAAHFVPDKGGVYFGLGLARLNQGRNDGAAQAFALEALNDPAFFSSPWWREPAIAALRPAAAVEFTRLLREAGTLLPPSSWAAAQLPRLAARAPTLGEVPAGAERTYRRERTGYPVLMRDLDLPPPVDVFDVREIISAPGTNEPLPPKGWLPSPLLVTLLDSAAAANALPAGK